MDNNKQNPGVREAAALKYDPEDHDAPVLVAVGRGEVADRIVARGEEYDVPIVPDAGLAQVLSQLSVGDVILPELYNIVAEILIYVNRVDEKWLGHG